ncbi:uncharacterized protein BJ171DRAFT_512113 [Polychytrium aggregatum]|uniref:uncharacterized protein n=1 Tax=Polychytrium aggregatum TaxID=110093 RepID=UPI0022FEC482|nr:uncharacterized protein BJ171DRAFT_512113 [Polychytrium aggregatum]KAI9202811.1 hypothetical protein BJ171DRAFT_512113 [Polychytrium aggregatum]
MMGGKATYSLDEVQEHHTAKSLWLIIDDQVYDLTEFLFDHPGGEEYLLQYGGQDVTEVMKDKILHLHSDAAYTLLEQYHIGSVDRSQTKKPASARPVATQQASTPLHISSKEKVKFIDITKPMLTQVWNGNFSKELYVQQVHIPRHCSGSAPLFASPYLEIFSKTPWYVIPVFWAPVILYNIWYCSFKYSPVEVAALFALGLFLWTFIEYSLHRFIFHIDELLPDNRVAITLHFLLHGIHHYLPMDRLRLVMPPALGLALSLPIWYLYHVVLTPYIGAGAIAGSYTGFVLYDMMHYYLHHGKPYGDYLKEMKSYHLDHHYKNAHLGFGISSKLWDIVFNTLLV